MEIQRVLAKKSYLFPVCIYHPIYTCPSWKSTELGGAGLGSNFPFTHRTVFAVVSQIPSICFS